MRVTVHPNDSKYVYDIIKPNLKDGPWIAGGAVMRWVQGQPVGDSDIDVFCKSEKQAMDLVKTLDYKQWYRACVTANAFTYASPNQRVKIQVILKKYYPNIKSVIESFDIRACQLATDGEIVVSFPDAYEDIKNKSIVISKPNEGIVRRILKYTNYGYSMTEETKQYVLDHADELKFNFTGMNEYDNAF